MDQTVVRETISVTTQNVTEADKLLGSEFNRVAHRALQVAERYLLFGPEDARLSVTKSFLMTLARLSALDTKSEVEEHRLAFLHYLSNQTDVPHHAPSLETSSRSVDDQDDLT